LHIVHFFRRDSTSHSQAATPGPAHDPDMTGKGSDRTGFVVNEPEVLPKITNCMKSKSLLNIL